MLRKYKCFIVAFVVDFIVELIIRSLANGLSFDTVLSCFLRSISFSVLFWAAAWFFSLRSKKYYDIGFEDGYNLGRFQQSIQDYAYNFKDNGHSEYDDKDLINVHDYTIE